MSKKATKKELRECLEWIASEDKYLLDLKKDLEILKTDSENALQKNQKDDLNRAFRDFRYVAKSFNRWWKFKTKYQKSITAKLYAAIKLSRFRITDSRVKQGTATPAEYEFLLKFFNRLQFLHNQNIRFASRFEGVLRKDIIDIQNTIKSSDDPKFKITRLINKIKEFEKWLAAIVVDSKTAERIGMKIVDPKQLELWPHSYLDENTEFLLKRVKNKTFRDTNRFHEYTLEKLEDVIINVLESHPKLMSCPSMTFVIKIYGIGQSGFEKALNAYCSVQESLGFNEKTINLGNLFLFLQVIFSKDLFHKIDIKFKDKILHRFEMSEESPYFQNPERSISALAGKRTSSDKVLSLSVAEVILHELTHATDSRLKYYQDNLFVNIFPKTILKIYGNDLIIPYNLMMYLGMFFTACQTEALAIFAQQFFEWKGRSLRGLFIPTFNLKETTKKFYDFFKEFMEYITKNEGKTPELFRDKSGMLSAINHDIYPFAHLMNMIIVIDTILRNKISTIIITEDKTDQIKETFPISYGYLMGDYGFDHKPVDIAADSKDYLMYRAFYEQDLQKVINLLTNEGIVVINDHKLFKKYYEKNAEFLIYKFDQRYVLQILKKIELAHVNLYEMYKESCRRLDIDCALDEPKIGQIFYQAIQQYNFYLRKIDYSAFRKKLSI